jgi:hypothetical protein
LQATTHICPRLLVQQISFEAVAKHLSSLYTCFHQFSNMSRTGSPFEDEDIRKEKGKRAVIDPT